MSIKSFCPQNCVPPPGQSVNFEDFLLICTVFPFSGGGGGVNQILRTKNYMDTQTFLRGGGLQVLSSSCTSRLSPPPLHILTSAASLDFAFRHTVLAFPACLAFGPSRLRGFVHPTKSSECLSLTHPTRGEMHQRETKEGQG